MKLHMYVYIYIYDYTCINLDEPNSTRLQQVREENIANKH